MANFEMDTGRTLRAFTNGTYAVHEALYELIDNSEAADASQVYIKAEKGGDEPISRVVVSDNGVGMTPKKLLESLKFAGDRKRAAHEISEYGIGLKVASFSMANQFTIVTKAEDGDVCGAFLCLETISKNGTFEGPLEAPKSRNYDELWELYAVNPDDCGTIVVLDDIKIQYSNCKSFLGKKSPDLKKRTGLHTSSRLSTRYADKISSGFKIFTVNGKGDPTVVDAYDPLMRNVSDTEVILDNHPVCATKYNNCNFNVSLTRIDPGGKHQFGIYIKIAGTVVAVDDDTLLGIYKPGTSHSYRWGLRGEISFSNKSEFDKVMIATSHKHSYNLKEPSFGDWIRDHDFGKYISAEQPLRQKLNAQKKLIKDIQEKKNFDNTLVGLLNTQRTIFGSSRHLRDFHGKISKIVDGQVSSAHLISELQGNKIICNSSNPVMARFLELDHRNARLEAVFVALVDAAKKSPTSLEQSEFRINLQIGV